jgi:hypothetical protein
MCGIEACSKLIFTVSDAAMDEVKVTLFCE